MDVTESQRGARRIGPRGFQLLAPRHWGFAVRSAAISASVVLVALVAAAAALLALLHGALLSAVDDAERARISEIVEALQSQSPDDLDESMLATSQRISVIQIVDPSGTVVRHSPGAPTAALESVDASADPGTVDSDGLRVSARTATTPAGAYTVIVGGGTEAVATSMRTVALLLAVAAPWVMGETALVSYILAKRSLSSVDAIRSRVADISTSDLSERVPVPTGRDEIASLAVTMNEMLDRVEKGHLAQRQFVGDASHELRSPLTTILSALEVIDAHPHLLSHDLITGTLLPEANRMKVLVEDLLLLARADEAMLAPRREIVHLDQVVADETARIHYRSPVAVHTEVDRVTVMGDVSGLSRVLRNLLDNAAQYADSRLDIAVHEDSGQTVISVADDGPGIPESERQRVFNRFVRLDTDRSRRSGGAGLGLPIVAEIIAAHEGSVTIHARPGGGTLVKVVLPSGQ